MRAAALLVLAACGAPAPPEPLTSHARSPRAPTTAPPLVTFASMQLAATGLPAVAADGSRVVHTVIDGDGGRGNPNMVIAVRDRSDRELDRFVVMTANESEGQFDDRGPAAPLAENIAAANTRLATLHANHDLRPLAKLASEPNPLANDEGNHAQGEGLMVDLGTRLTIRTEGRVVVDLARPASWSMPDKQMCPSCSEICRHPLYLGAAYAAAAHTLVLVTVSYAGTDLCPEPVGQHHVITW